MIDMIKFIKKELPSTKIIAGNVATRQAVIDLANAGADVVKVRNWSRFSLYDKR